MLAYGHSVSVIPAAASGVPLSCWELTGDCFRGIMRYRKLPFVGVIWWQGETDALSCNTSLSKTYAVRFSRMISDWRTFFNNPNLPFYVVQLGHSVPSLDCGGVPNKWEEVKAAQVLVATTLPNVYLITTEDITTGDSIHPSGVYSEIGRRLAAQASARISEKPGRQLGFMWK
jgi:hypothetical protein